MEEVEREESDEQEEEAPNLLEEPINENEFDNQEGCFRFMAKVPFKEKQNQLINLLQIIKNFQLMKNQQIEKTIRRSQDEFLIMALEMIKNSKLLREVYLLVIEMEYPNKNKEQLIQKIEDFLWDLATNIKKKVFFVCTPFEINGYTSNYFDIFLKYDYLIYELPHFEKWLKSCFVLSFVHEVMHYIRRMLALFYGKNGLSTPILSDDPKGVVLVMLEKWNINLEMRDT